MTALYGVQRMIYQCILENPGVHFREILRRLATGKGSLERSIRYLVEQQYVYSVSSFGRKMFFSIAFPPEQCKLVGALRQNRIRQILTSLLEKKKCAASISEEVEISPQLAHWYLNKLETLGLISSSEQGDRQFYNLDDKHMVTYLLEHYEISSSDKLSDRFIDCWES